MRACLLIALLLAACGQASAPRGPDLTLPDDEGPLFGAIVAVGEDWQLNGNPDDAALSIYMDDGTEASGTWVRPYYAQGRISAGGIRVTLENTACEQNDIPYPMRAAVTLPGHTLTGCAAMRWDHLLSELMPEIDACIAAAPERRTVTYAGEMPDGSTLVRVRAGDDMQDCRVTGGTARFSPRDDNVVVATENAAIFLRARRGETQNPGGECYDAPEAVVYSGHPAVPEMVGWMLDPMGC